MGEVDMKRVAAVLLAAGAAAAVLLVAPRPAMADTVLGTCPLGSSTVTYSPGVTDTEQETFQTGSEQSGLCTFVFPLGLRSFTDSFSGPLTTSCTELLTGSDSGQETLHWSNGQTSEWNFSSITSQDANGNTVATYTGPLSAQSQFLPGALVTQVVTYTHLTVQSCQQSPLTQQSGTSTYTFTQGT
jgi:hypothetical protein